MKQGSFVTILVIILLLRIVQAQEESIELNLNEIDYTNENHREALKKFFAKDPQHMNEHNDIFIKMLNEEGVKISQSGNAQFDFRFDTRGWITSDKYRINIYDTKHLFSFKIDESGHLHIIDNNNNPHSFSGELISTSSGFELFADENKETSIDGVLIRGTELSFENGKIYGIFTSINGVTFDKPTEAHYDRTENVLLVSDTTISKIDRDITIKGERINLPKGDILNKGSIRFTQGIPTLLDPYSDALVSYWHHTTTDNPLYIRYISNNQIMASVQREKEILEPLLLQYTKAKKNREQASQMITQAKEKEQEMERELNPAKESDLKIEARDLLEKASRLRDNEFFLRDKIAEIQRRYRSERNEIYHSFISQQHLPVHANYFMQGSDIVIASGTGFTSELKQRNLVFSGFKDMHQLSPDRPEENIPTRLSINLEGGKVILEPGSEEGTPQTIHATAEGRLRIKNGNWETVTNGKEILLTPFKTPSLLSKIFGTLPTYAGTDMMLDYKTDDGKTRKYEYNTNIFYDSRIPAEKISELRSQIAQKTELVQQKRAQISHMTSTDRQLSSYLTNYEQQLSILKDLKKSKEKAEKELERARSVLTQTSENNRQIQQRETTFRKKVEDLDQQIRITENQIGNLKQQHPAVRLRSELEILENEINNAGELLMLDAGQNVVGYFGERITTPQGTNAFANYIENLGLHRVPGVKTQPYETALQIHSSELSNTVSGRRFDIPLYNPGEGTQYNIGGFDNNAYTIISGSETCSDVQIRCYTEFQKSEIKKGGRDKIALPGYKPTWTPNSEEDFTEYLRGTYASFATGSLWKMSSRDLPLIKNAEDIQSGDVILKKPNKQGYGHTEGVLGVIEINGKRFVDRFAGSDPAIVPRRYTNLISTAKLNQGIRNGEYQIRRWFPNTKQAEKEELASQSQTEHINLPVLTPYLGVVTTQGGRLNVRSSAKIGNNRIGALNRDTQVSIVGESGDWYQIRYGSDTAFVNKQYVKIA
ncbi:MAG: SH3 domain-containing protein [Nanoarchaeota archaeon]